MQNQAIRAQKVIINKFECKKDENQLIGAKTKFSRHKMKRNYLFISRYLQEKQMINLDKLDPDWKFATQHGLANKAGLPKSDLQASSDTSLSANPNSLLCKCCYEHVYKTPMSLWENSKQLQFLGFGFPLFYEFLKNCIILLVLATCSYNAISIKTALENNYDLCHQSSSSHRLLAAAAQTTTKVSKICYTFMIELARIQQSVTNQEQALRIISFVLHLLALLYVRNRITKLEAYYDERTTSLSDYSIFVKGLTKMKGIQGKLRQFLQKQFTQPHKICQITLLPEYQQIEDLEKQKKQLINSLKQHYERDDKQNESAEMSQKIFELTKIEKQIHSAALTSKQKAVLDELECEKIICVFDTEHEKEQILQQFANITKETKIKYFGQQGGSVYFKQAPEPQEIIWQNANLGKRKKFLFILLGWSLSVIVLVIVFVIFFLILQKKSLVLEAAIQELSKHPKDQIAQTQYRGALSLIYILMFLVVIFDKIAMSSLFHKFTTLEMHSTTSKFQFSYELKMLLGLFFTTALMTLAVEAIRFHNYYSHPYGVIDQETIMFFMNSFFVPFFWLLNPTRIYKQIKQKLYFGKRSLTQRQANNLMQDEKYDMGKRFAEILQMMWFTYLYSTLIPVGTIITIFGLCFYYWVDKYNLLRRSSVSGQISGQIIQTSITLLDFTLILRPVGAIIFDTQIRNSYMPSNVAMIVIAFVYIILPKNKLIQFINGEKFRLQSKSYTSVKDTFHKTYHTEHPIYRIIHSQKLEKRMLKKGHSFEQLSNSIIGMVSEGNIKDQSNNRIEIKSKMTQIQLGL